jgi:Ca2+-binding RTX toxin-like protein
VPGGRGGDDVIDGKAGDDAISGDKGADTLTADGPGRTPDVDSFAMPRATDSTASRISTWPPTRLIFPRSRASAASAN